MAVRIFVAGDLHIPSRAAMLHPNFQLLLEKEKWDYIVLTGDHTLPSVVQSFKSHLKNKQNLIACRGNMDRFQLPLQPTFSVHDVNLGVYHGTDIYPRGDIDQLKAKADEMKVRVLFTGHSHQIEFYYDDKHAILNPGTSTGATGGTAWTVDVGIFILEIIDTQEISIELFEIAQRNRIRSQKQKIKF
ncbi:MAG: YfcE family phosphodiesterase [Asgard group archaeon]|nr:YfcE family phosphodiesterase [Asgard group archaeon]